MKALETHAGCFPMFSRWFRRVRSFLCREAEAEGKTPLEDLSVGEEPERLGSGRCVFVALDGSAMQAKATVEGPVALPEILT